MYSHSLHRTTTPHELCWGDQEMETAFSCEKKKAVRWLALSKRLVEVASFPDPTQLSVACSMAAR